MKYLVFNQFTGQHDEFTDLNSAKIHQNILLKQYAEKCNIGTHIVCDCPIKEQTFNIVKEWIKNNLNIESCEYFYSVYNATTQKNKYHFYLANLNSTIYGIKIDLETYEIVELYKNHENGAVSLDLQTHEILEYYERIDTKVIKKDKDGNILSETFSGRHDNILDDKKELLNNFEYKNNILRWSEKPYGFCVEYVERKIKKIEECSALEIHKLVMEKQQFIETNRSVFNIVEVVMKNGNEVWRTL